MKLIKKKLEASVKKLQNLIARNWNIENMIAWFTTNSVKHLY